jgi:uncharacterized cysteine cluster protein YcgN (CxxCxxCC family)
MVCKNQRGDMRKYDCGALSRSFQNSVTQFPHCCGYCGVTEGRKYFFSPFYWHRALKLTIALPRSINRDRNATA